MAKNRLGEAERVLPLNKRGRGKGKRSSNRTLLKGTAQLIYTEIKTLNEEQGKETPAKC